jgi:hypothetical protein
LAWPYSDFASIGGASLDMVAGGRGVRLSPIPMCATVFRRCVTLG